MSSLDSCVLAIEHSDTAANPGCQTVNTKTPAIGLRAAGLQSQATVERYTDQPVLNTPVLAQNCQILCSMQHIVRSIKKTIVILHYPLRKTPVLQSLQMDSHLFLFIISVLFQEQQSSPAGLEFSQPPDITNRPIVASWLTSQCVTASNSYCSISRIRDTYILHIHTLQ